MSEVSFCKDEVASSIAAMWTDLNNQRTEWLGRAKETRAYVTAPSTTYTEVGSQTPWKNKTTIPILTQIADTLQSYYMAALMPTDDWFRWEGRDITAQQKAQLIEEYMATKLRISNFRTELTKIVRDWVIYGNCFAGITYVKESTKSLVDGTDIVNYQGPRLQRISPLDCVIDINASSFEKSPLLIRKLVPIADILSHNETQAAIPYNEEGVAKVAELRNLSYREDFVQQFKDDGIRVDGFQDFGSYLAQQYVEVLEFWGDIFDPKTGEYLKNRVITIADRSIVLRNDENPAWNGKKPFIHVGWRILPDNLYAQGPLDNLVGMQYRIDHLENLKADAFDQIIHPMIKLTGDTVDDDFEFGPGQRIYCGADGDVEFLRPDTTVLSCDSQIAMYRQLMEISVGSPRESSGFRTPGEKTAFEVNVLQQGADRMFQDKLNHFEEVGIQPILNLMFELMMRNFDIQDVARVFNANTGAMELATFTKEDVVADGVFRPMGSTYYAARNKRIQEIQNLLMLSDNVKLSPHVSGLNIGKMFEEELGFEKWNVVEENIGTREAINTQMFVQQMQEQMGTPQAEPT